MRFAKRLPIAGVFFIGLLLAAGNLWHAAARSTIPLRLNAKIVDLQIANEKHPGFDDVFFLVLDDGRRLHVDQPVFRALKVGDVIEKRPLADRSLEILHPGGHRTVLPLAFSADFRGMQIVMPIALGVGIALTCLALRAQRRLLAPSRA